MAEETEATPVAGWHWPYMEREEFEGEQASPLTLYVRYPTAAAIPYDDHTHACMQNTRA